MITLLGKRELLAFLWFVVFYVAVMFCAWTSFILIVIFCLHAQTNRVYVNVFVRISNAQLNGSADNYESSQKRLVRICKR